MHFWVETTIAEPIEIAWNFMKLTHEPVRSDAILALGSFDVEVARVAARLWRAEVAPFIVMSGGLAHQGGLLDTGWDRPEAEVFCDRAIAEGVPRHSILIENEAQNTGENFIFSRRLLASVGLHPRKLTVVAKPYMTRRAWATGRRVWPDAELFMQCEDIGPEAYFARDLNPARTLSALVGDLHRIFVYPALGFSAYQESPPEVMAAFRYLVAAGYGQRLVPGHAV